MYCPQCGAENKASSSFCIKCGTPIRPFPIYVPGSPGGGPVQPGSKNPVVAALINIVLPGIGEIYCRQYLRGLVFVIPYVVFVALFFSMVQYDWWGNVYYNYWLLVPGWILFACSAVDSYYLAKGIDIIRKGKVS
jgi:hypothetical protein